MISKIVSTTTGAKTHRRLVEHEQLGAGHQPAAHREHLLLAAGQRAALLGDALLEAREELEDTLEVGLDAVLVLAKERAHLEVLETVMREKMRRPSGTWTMPLLVTLWARIPPICSPRNSMVPGAG